MHVQCTYFPSDFIKYEADLMNLNLSCMHRCVCLWL